MDDKRPSDLVGRVVVRTPDGLRDRLNERARENKRSANAEAIAALQAWLARDPASDFTLSQLPEQLQKRVVAAAKLNSRRIVDEITARLADSFKPVAPRHIEDDQRSLRAEIRDAMHEAVEGLLADPERLKRLGYVPAKATDGNEPITD